MELKQAFGQALRLMRKARLLSQEDFGGYCSQTYLSQLETGAKAPSLEMVNMLASAMGVHPLTVLMECYLLVDDSTNLEALIERIRDEVNRPPMV